MSAFLEGNHPIGVYRLVKNVTGGSFKETGITTLDGHPYTAGYIMQQGHPVPALWDSDGIHFVVDDADRQPYVAHIYWHDETEKNLYIGLENDHTVDWDPKVGKPLSVEVARAHLKKIGHQALAAAAKSHPHFSEALAQKESMGVSLGPGDELKEEESITIKKGSSADQAAIEAYTNIEGDDSTSDSDSDQEGLGMMHQKKPAKSKGRMCVSFGKKKKEEPQEQLAGLNDAMAGMGLGDLSDDDSPSSGEE